MTWSARGRHCSGPRQPAYIPHCLRCNVGSFDRIKPFVPKVLVKSGLGWCGPGHLRPELMLSSNRGEERIRFNLPGLHVSVTCTNCSLRPCWQGTLLENDLDRFLATSYSSPVPKTIPPPTAEFPGKLPEPHVASIAQLFEVLGLPQSQPQKMGENPALRARHECSQRLQPARTARAVFLDFAR
jgi:hypothetical protein